jgi:hypothetical protein
MKEGPHDLLIDAHRSTSVARALDAGVEHIAGALRVERVARP